MRKLRLGVIGAGSWTVASHLPNFERRRDEVEFVAVCRKGTERLEQIRERWGFELASEDYRDVLGADLDICLVASPHGLHFEHAKAALEAGAHVLCEKPFTVAPRDAWELVDLAGRTGKHLIVAYGWNYLPWVRTAKRLMDDHGIGSLEQSMLHMGSATRELLLGDAGYVGDALEAVPPDGGTWTDPRNGGGYGQAQLSHALGLALWLTGQRGETAFALTAAPTHAPVELHETAVIRFDDGAIGTMGGCSFHLSAGGNRHQLEFRAVGSEGQLMIDLERDELWFWRRDGMEIRPQLPQGAFAYNCDGPVNALVDLALGKDSLNCSPAELGARAVEILDAAYRSAASGSPQLVER